MAILSYEQWERERMIKSGQLKPATQVSIYEGQAVAEEARKLWVAEHKKKLIRLGILTLECDRL